MYYTHRNFFINNNINIAVSACFYRYFLLTLEDDAIPTATIKQLIFEATESEFEEGMKRLYQEEKIVRLLEEIEVYANNKGSVAIATERASLIIRCLARQWSSFEVDDSGLLSVPFAWRLLSRDEQMDIVVFLLTVERKPETGLANNYVFEEAIQKEMNKLDLHA